MRTTQTSSGACRAPSDLVRDRYASARKTQNDWRLLAETEEALGELASRVRTVVKEALDHHGLRSFKRNAEV
ncbi:MAG TPA: hypothetical protein VEK07_02820 [Polyangiaceae bacterium]|nr:hypothetical protein [Polyangiaceae bacterium]